MKNDICNKICLALASISLMLMGTASSVLATPNYPAFGGFDNSNYAGGLIGTPAAGLWYGTPLVNMYWTNVDSGAVGDNPGSGSLYVTATWNASDPADNVAMGIAFQTNYVQFNNTSNLINGYVYTNIEFDIKWDTTASTIPLNTWNVTGDPIGIGIGLLVNPGVGQIALQGNNTSSSDTNAYIPLAATNGWVHMSIPIARTAIANIDQVMGLWIKKYYNGPLGTAAYFIDNVTFDGAPALPPPTISLSSQAPTLGLNLAAIGSSNPYQRDGLLAYPTDFSWVGHGSTPVTYAINIKKYPSSSNSGFNTHMFIYPGTGTEAEPDWTEANIVYISIQNDSGDNGGSITFQCKTNAPNGNGGDGNLGGFYNNAQYTNVSLNSSTMLGTWAVTFLNDTNITMTAPDGSTTNFPFPFFMTAASVQSAFGTGPMSFNVGIQPNNAGNIGQGAVIGYVAVTNAGSSGNFYDNFVTDTTNGTGLSINAGGGSELWIYATDASPSTNSVFLTDPTPSTVLTWQYPNGYNFMLETNSNLSNPGGWSTNVPYTTVAGGLTVKTVIPAPQLPPGNLFFRAIQNTNIP